jgi:hypothetical protein
LGVDRADFALSTRNSGWRRRGAAIRARSNGEIDMADLRYFDKANSGAANVMARRQFGISLIVALALLAAAGMKAAGVRHETPVGMAARHALTGAAPARAPVAQASLETMIAV